MIKTKIIEILLRNWQNKKIIIMSKDFNNFKVLDDVEYLKEYKNNITNFYYYFYFLDFGIIESKQYSIYRFLKNKDKLYKIKEC